MASGNRNVEELSGIVMFADLSRPELEAIDRIFDEEVFDDGRRILRPGVQGSNFYVIVDGEAVVEHEGKELARLGRGEYFGEMSILLGEVPWAEVSAVGLLRCRVLPGDALEEFLIKHPRVMYRMLQAETLRLRAAYR